MRRPTTRGIAGSLLLALAMAAPAGALRSEVTGELGEGRTLFSVRHQTVTVVEADVLVWRGEGWAWVDMNVSRSPLDAATRRAPITGLAWSHGTRLDGHVAVGNPGEATWTLRLSEDPQGATDVFAAVAFRISADVLERAPASVPELRPDKTGWSFVVDPGLPPVVVTFSEPVKELYFEQENHGEIRALILARDPKPETAEFRMTLTLPGAFVPAFTERLAARDATWWPNDFHWNRSPVDLAFLNAGEKPAGKRGFLRAVGEDLVFEDGTKARFWGTNISASALFQASNPETVRSQARRLSSLGFNLVRLHHHDSDWVAPNIFGVNRDGTRQLASWALDALGWWIKCLRDEGIYVWLDLHVGRMLTAADGVEAFDEIAEGKPSKARMMGYLFVNESIQARMKEFADAYLSHVNPHTGLAFKDDPAIVTVLVTNENDLTHHFGNSLLPDKNVPWHTERYMGLAQRFATTHALDSDRVWRSWEFGPSKIFLADLEHAYFRKATEDLRDLGVKVPIIGTNYWGGMSAAGLPALAEGDIVDAHVYGRANEVEKNPRFNPTMASGIATGAVAGKPFSVSEWNAEPSPVPDRHQMPPHLAAIASLQAWDAMLQYAYTQAPMMTRAFAGAWESYTDPGLMALMPAAALLYRNRHVSEARASFELSLPEDVFTGRHIHARTSRAIRTLTETSKLRIRIPEIQALGWVTRRPPASGVREVTDPDFDAIGDGHVQVCSDTGELCRNWETGVFTVDTARSQIASGWIGGREVALADVAVSLETPNATVAVQSLDERPIARAQRIMISISAQAELAASDVLPYFSEPVVGKVRIRAPDGLKAYRADRDGGLHPMAFERSADDYVLSLEPDLKANWLFLQ